MDHSAAGHPVNARLAFAGVGVLALLAGSALWLGTRGPGAPAIDPAAASPAAIQTARFADASGQVRVLGQFQGQVVVVNVSRAVVGETRADERRVVVLQVTAPAAIRAERLSRRGRETPDIMARVTRTVPPLPAGLPVISIKNDRTPAHAAGLFITALRRIAEGAGAKAA